MTPVRFGLNDKEYKYARQLALQAAHGTWINPYGDDAPLIDRSAKLLSGGNADAAAERELLITLLKLACYSPEHEWEAPTLTGKPTTFALQTLEKITAFNA